METTDDFRQSLHIYSPMEVVQRFVTAGECAALNPHQYAELRQLVSRRFEIHHSDVIVVGSAKLGFSIAPDKRWRQFSDNSDVDVAVVAPDLYKKIWREIARLVSADPTFNWPRKRNFSKHHLVGWLRPDALPVSPALTLADEWFEFFRELTNTGVCGPYKIAAGVYYDIHFLEQYQTRAVTSCADEETQ